VECVTASNRHRRIGASKFINLLRERAHVRAGRGLNGRAAICTLGAIPLEWVGTKAEVLLNVRKTRLAIRNMVNAQVGNSEDDASVPRP
jgi:hypothetical protein